MKTGNTLRLVIAWFVFVSLPNATLAAWQIRSSSSFVGAPASTLTLKFESGFSRTDIGPTLSVVRFRTNAEEIELFHGNKEFHRARAAGCATRAEDEYFGVQGRDPHGRSVGPPVGQRVIEASEIRPARARLSGLRGRCQKPLKRFPSSHRHRTPR